VRAARAPIAGNGFSAGFIGSPYNLITFLYGFSDFCKRSFYIIVRLAGYLDIPPSRLRHFSGFYGTVCGVPEEAF
jgi:hypothetical protein